MAENCYLHAWVLRWWLRGHLCLFKTKVNNRPLVIRNMENRKYNFELLRHTVVKMVPSSILVPLIEGSDCTACGALFSTSTSLLISPYSSRTKGFVSSHLQTPSTKNRYWIAPKGHINVCAGTENVTGETEYCMQIAGQWALVHQIYTTAISGSNSLLAIEWNQIITCEQHDRQNLQ